MLVQLDVEENHALGCVQIACEVEWKRVEEDGREVGIGFMGGWWGGLENGDEGRVGRRKQKAPLEVSYGVFTLIHSFTAEKTPRSILNLSLTSHASCVTNWRRRHHPRLSGCQICQWRTGWVVWVVACL